MKFYTKIFVDANVELADLITHVSRIVDGTVSIDTVLTNALELDVKRNDLGSSACHNIDDGFLAYGFTVEIVNTVDMLFDLYLEAVGNIMMNLSERGHSVVASCGWEEKLPGGGRIIVSK
ncbi:hypothetical protein [Vibrio penaeicida]|uniref:Uncharacterized protein n=1 Tax=Vibrio penaeicida TaxID=104609 RepID=A0AAV5NZT4_9VIBR|nr:hypothetical protein [Vibrio penaeicida]RTZ23970.1 hypothetical protein EKN09_06040 [Vibrio penaeicida]GLQ75833.1 hypothetical protein GCM10007932_51960 [Vibrio penaeicida]